MAAYTGPTESANAEPSSGIEGSWCLRERVAIMTKDVGRPERFWLTERVLKLLKVC